MPTTAARLTAGGDFLISGEINERSLPVVSDYKEFYPFDSINSDVNSLQGVKVLSLERFTTNGEGVYGSHQTGNLRGVLVAGGANLTVHDVSANGMPSVATAKLYDIVIFDVFVWGVGSNEVTTLKSYTDAGVSCMASGNDSTTNIFVKSIATRTRVSGNILFVNPELSIPFTQTKDIQVSVDALNIIKELQNGALPLSYLQPDNQAAGFIYYSPAGAAFAMDYMSDGATSTFRPYIAAVLRHIISLTKSDTNTTNSIFNNGLVLTHPATQLASTNWTNWNHYNNLTYWASNTTYQSPEYGQVFKGVAKENIQLFIFKYYPLTVAVGDRLSFSVKFRTNKKITKSYNMYTVTNQTGSQVQLQNSTPVTVTSLPGEWTELRFTIILSTAATQVGYGITWSGSTTQDEYEFAQPILTRDWVPSNVFTTTSRVQSGLNITRLGITGDFGLMFKFRPHAEYHKYATSAATPTLIKLMDIAQNLQISFRHYHATPALSNTSSVPFFDLEPNASWVNTGNAHFHTYMACDMYSDIYIGISKVGHTLILRVVNSQGVTITNQVFTVTANISLPSFNLEEIRFGDSDNTSWAGIVSDFHIMSREVQIADLNKLAKPIPFLSKNGNVLEPTREASPTINDVFHFPLDSNTWDTTGTVKASEELNLVYENGAVWVGGPTVNLIINPTTEVASTEYTGNYTDGQGNAKTWDRRLHLNARNPATGWSSGINTGISNPDAGYHAQLVPNEGITGRGTIKLINRNSAITKAADGTTTINIAGRWLGISQAVASTTSSLGVTTGSNLTLSYFAKSDTPGGIVHTGLYHRQISDGTFAFTTSGKSSVSHTVTAANMWEREVETWLVDSNWDLSGYVALYLYGHYGIESTKWVSNVQLELRPFATPFTPTSRPAGSLEFHLNRDIGLNWGGDWTIGYWKKPVGTDNNTLAGYNIDSLGCNSNTVGNSYLWWGKSSSGNVIMSGGAGTASNMLSLTPSTYFNQWHYQVIRKTGNLIEFITWTRGNPAGYITKTLTNLTTNSFVTPYGYDLKLGGWDNSNACYTFYRNLSVAKRSLSDAEITSLRNGIQLLRNTLYSSGTIAEGQAL